MRLVLFLSVLLLLAIGCQVGSGQMQMPACMFPDIHSFAKAEFASVTHLHWKALVDFDKKTIHAVASWDIMIHKDTGIIVFDTKGLSIEKVMLNNNQPTEFKLAQEGPILGQALEIAIKPDTKIVSIEYTTSTSAEALQWL